MPAFKRYKMVYLVPEQLLHLTPEKLMDKTYSLKVHPVSVSHSSSQDFSVRRSIVRPLIQFCRELNEESFGKKDDISVMKNE